jgi:hypothetical protein
MTGRGTPNIGRRRGRGFARSDAGSAVTEFGLIAPVFFLLMMGIYDVTHMVYARSVFNGAVERAAREASLETGDTTAADELVEDTIRPVLPDVSLASERKSYFDFADIGRPEQFTDIGDEDGNGLGDGICNFSEPYVDENSSGSWDADVGRSGNGGAGDVVIYTVTATYSPVFKIPFMPESWASREMTAVAVKKNQPFADQQAYSSNAGTCEEEET